MYRELIADAAKNIEYSILQPPCPESEIAKAEAYIGHRFPYELRALLKETNGDRFLLLSVDEMVERVRINREILAEGIDEDVYAEIESFVFFATNGIGDYYYYKASANGTIDESTIYIWEHETFEYHKVADSLAELITKYYNDEV